MNFCKCKGSRPFRELKDDRLKCGFCHKEIKGDIQSVSINKAIAQEGDK